MTAEPKSSLSKGTLKEEFLELSEEEKIEWAKKHKAKVYKRNRLIGQAQLKKNKLRELVKDRMKKARKEKLRPDPIKREVYNEKRRLRYQHNPQFRETEILRAILRYQTKKKLQLNHWVHAYKLHYSKKLEDYAETFEVADEFELYSLGFSVKALGKVTPVSASFLNRLIDMEVLPPPTHRGYLFQKKRIKEEVTLYYTLPEVSAILYIWSRYWRQYKQIDENFKFMWLKKQFWENLKNDK